jgi:hypothetical protein
MQTEYPEWITPEERIATVKSMQKNVARMEVALADAKSILAREERSTDLHCPGWRAKKTKWKTKPKRGNVSMPADEEEQFIELVKLWRLDHSPRQFPKGITTREQNVRDGDCGLLDDDDED